jgi:chromosome segregation ATPase
VVSCASGQSVYAQQPTAKQGEISVSGPIADQKLHAAVALKMLEDEVDRLKKEADELRGVQRDLRNQVRAKCGLSPENVMPVMLSLERDKFSLEIEFKLKSARKAGLADLIAKETAISRLSGDKDEVTGHLKHLVEARQAALALVTAAHNAASAPETDVRNAQAELAEAQIRLALRKEGLAKSHADADIDRLNRQLLDLSVEFAQDQLRLELLKEQLTALADVQGVLDEYKRVSESELPRVLRLLDQAESRMAEVKTLNPQ